MFDGTLTSFDPINPNRIDRFSDSFLLAGIDAGDVVQLTLDSVEIDPFLQVVDFSTNTVVAFNDDISFPTNTNSQLSFTAQAGVTYIVRATTFAAGDVGSYTISNSDGNLIPIPLPFIDAIDSATGTLSPDDFTSPNRVGHFRDDFFLDDFTVGSPIQIDVSGTFDTFLEVVDAASGAILFSDDDGGLGTNSQLTFTPQPNASYLFRVSSFGTGETGNYSITTTPAPAFGPFRSIDGTGNNLSDPEIGSAGTELLTIAPTAFADGGSALAGEDRPGPREISNALGQQNTDMPSQRLLTNFIWAFGQFLDHDLSLTPSQSREDAIAHNEFANISIPTGDEFLDPAGTGTVEIEFRRSEFVPGTGTGPGNPREYDNEITHWIDLSSVYGSDDARAATLRNFNGGQLAVSPGNLLPLAGGEENDNPGPTPANDLFLAGDVRANENVVLSSMHTLFVREHNRLASELATLNPGWTDELLYQRAREVNIAQWQNIVYNEYLPTLLGTGVVPAYTGYNSTVDPRIGRTFSTAAYRFGHTQLSSEIERIDTNGNTLPEGNLTLFESFFPSASVVQSTGIDPILRGVASSLSQEVDLQLIDDVRNLLFNFGGFTAAQDLFALNIQRGRDHGLPDYNTVRSAFGLTPVTSFADITSDVETQLTLENLYGDIDNIDAFVGLLAEDHLPGGSVGETIAVVLVDQFTRLRDGDRFYYENQFSPSEIALIEDTRLSDIIRRNTDTTIIQDNVFTLFNRGTNGADNLEGGLGDDVIFGLSGADTINGYAGDDTLRGQIGFDTIDAGDGDDIASGGSGNDTISGGAGDDSLSGGSGNDILNGQDGNDQLRGQRNDDRLRGGNGDDSVEGGSGNDILFGGQGNDDVEGGSGRDILVGVDPNTLFPGRGDRDELTGGSSGDRFVLGRAGTQYYDDLFVNPVNDSYAVITDYNRFQDVIQLAGRPNQYTLGAATIPGGPAINTGIFQTGSRDLIAIIEGQQIANFGRGFDFV